MSISEETRHRLYNRLEEVLGGDEAATLMAHLPPVGWGDVATKADLKSLATDASLRTEVAGLHTQLTDLRGELRTEIAKVRGDLGAQMRGQFFSLVGLQFSAAGLAFAFTKFL